MSNAVRLRLGFASLPLGMLESIGWADTACLTDAVDRAMQKARSAKIRVIVACLGILALSPNVDIEPKLLRIFLMLTCWSLW